MTTLDASQCRWQEAGGGEAAGRRCLAFLDGIGIPVREGAADRAQFLAGLAIAEGRLLIDPRIRVWPGDLLHEAGHIAVSEDRARLGPVPADGGDELAAIAWSWAAALACGLPADQLFHDGGYRGGGAALAAAFTGGSYPGAPLLAWFGLCRMAADVGPEPAYPAMLRWLR